MKQNTLTKEANCKKAITGFSKLHTEMEEIELWMCLVFFFRVPPDFFHLPQKCNLKLVPCCKILGTCQQRELRCDRPLQKQAVFERCGLLYVINLGCQLGSGQDQ